MQLAKDSQNILDKVGNTPLVKLDSLSDSSTYYAKLEGHNPFGSVKDRAAYWMIRKAEEAGILNSTRNTIIEPTSGNTGIALTGIANILGYKTEIVIPEKASEETKRIIKSLGAKMFETSDDLCPKVGAGTDQSIALATSIAANHADVYYSPNQYANEANFMGHYEGTGPELWKQTEGKITHFFTGVGTGGTITGVGTFLKEKNPNVQIIGCQPQKNHLIQGWRNFEESAKPDLFLKRESIVDVWSHVTNAEVFDLVLEILEKDKMLVSPSSAAVYACMKKHNVPSGSHVVGLFADDGRKFESVYVDQKIMTSEQFKEALAGSAHNSETFY